MATVTGSKRHLDITSDTLTTSSNVDVGAKLFITTTDSNTSSTTALVLNSTEVEARTLGSNAFNSTAFLTSETFSSSDVALSLGGNDIIAGTSITLAGGLSYNDSTSTLSQTDNNTTYSAGTLLDLSSTTFNVDLTELTNNTATFAPTQDHFVILDNGVQGKKLASSIFGSAAYEASTAFATASHSHAGVYAPEYENMSQASGADHDMHQWRKVHASYSNNGSNSTYLIVQTEVPQDNYSMGGFTLVYHDDYSNSGEGGEIKIYGYWNPESNGGFVGFRYECSNPYHTPTIEVCRNSDSGNTAFFISGEGGNYAQLIAKDMWLGYSASSATQQWGNGWVISEASDKTGYTNFNTLNRNDFPAITTDGSTPSLTGGVSAAEVRTLIGAQASGSYLTAHPSITQAANVNNSGGTVIQDLTFDENGHVTATNSVNLDNIYTSTDGTESDYRWSINLGSGTGTRWYKVGTVNVGSGGMTLRGLLSNHVESFATQQFDIAIQGRENNENGAIEITGNVNVLHGGVGVLVVSGEQPGSYLNWDVYIVTTNYSMAEIDLTKTSSGFHTSYSYETSKPSGTVELDTTTLAEGNYVIDDSVAKEIYHEGHKPTLAELGAASTAVATTSANGLMSSTDKSKLDGVESSADVTDSTNVAAAGALMASGNTLTGTMKVTGSIIFENDTDSGYIPFPKGAQYQTRTNSHTGAIKITLPTHGGDDMVKWVVDIYDYSTGESVTMFMGGYIYQATGGNEWVSCTVTTLTEHSSKDYTVRFGADGTKSCVWIGETNSTWSYPQVIVRDFYAGFISDIDAYDDNWSISFVTSFDTVDEIISDNLPTADWDRIEGKPTLGTAAAAATTDFAAASHSHSDATTSAAGFMSSGDKTKLDGIASGAEVNVQSDWNATSGDAFIQNKPTLGTASASAATDFISATNADTAAELITFAKGTTTDGNSKFYNWRALDNTAGTGNSFWRIARITSSQSSRFMITLAGRSTSYSDGSLPAMGHIVGQLNNDNNYDVVFYNHSTASSEVVTEVGIVNVSNTVVDVYIKAGQYAEVTATGHISDGSFAVYSNAGADGNTTVDGYITVTEYTVMNTGNSDVLYKSGGTMSGNILLGANSIAADTTSPTAHIQVGAGTTNTGSRSDVALLGAGNSGGVVHALGLVNTAAGTNSNGVALNFHNGNAWSPTGQIIVQQDSTGTSTNSAMKFYTYSGGLNHRMSIKSDGTIRFNAYGAGLIASDANGNLSVDTSTYLTGIAANSVGIGELNVSDGSAGQVLTTDGNGALSFTTVTSGSSYTLPAATSTALGGVKIGYTANAKNYPVQLDASNKAYVNVPWTDANTTYSAGSGLDLNSGAFSVEADLRDGITHVGVSTNNYITFDNANNHIDFYAGGTHVARMEAEGNLHIKGDVIAFSNLFA